MEEGCDGDADPLLLALWNNGGEDGDGRAAHMQTKSETRAEAFWFLCPDLRQSVHPIMDLFLSSALIAIVVVGNILAAWAAIGILSALTGLDPIVGAFLYFYFILALVFQTALRR